MACGSGTRRPLHSTLHLSLSVCLSVSLSLARARAVSLSLFLSLNIYELAGTVRGDLCISPQTHIHTNTQMYTYIYRCAAAEAFLATSEQAILDLATGPEGAPVLDVSPGVLALLVHVLLILLNAHSISHTIKHTHTHTNTIKHTHSLFQHFFTTTHLNKSHHYSTQQQVHAPELRQH